MELLQIPHGSPTCIQYLKSMESQLSLEKNYPSSYPSFEMQAISAVKCQILSENKFQFLIGIQEEGYIKKIPKS